MLTEIKEKRHAAKAFALLLALLLAFGAVAGCHKKGDEVNKPPYLEIEYSNLTDDESIKKTEELLKNAGVSDECRDVFFQHVKQFNKCVDAESLTKGFEKADVSSVKYDSYAMQDEWDAKNPDFIGYNCRITAFSLFKDFLSVKSDAEVNEEYILMDMSALDEDSSAMRNDEELEAFGALFSGIPTENTQDISVHAEKIRTYWADKGISFSDDKKIRLISVFFHDQISEDENYLFIGHTGILLPDESSGKLYFIEKVAFQEPYRVLKFDNRTALSDYLMIKYDVEWGQSTAKPFIFENDKLMDGYRSNPVASEPSEN
ncbi:MAG: DUF4300 family protein [Firmicutes bacterium]|nr:DUF4300 family protein [Bacillota bacterium]